MKILITTDLFTVTTNGVVTSVRNLWEELEGKGHEVRILTFSGDKESHKDGNVYYIKSVSLDFVYPDVRMPISYRNSIVKELIDWKPDVIHSQCEFFSYQFAQRISKLTGAPLVHTYHTLYEDYVGYLFPSKRFGRFFVRKWIRRRLRKADKVIAPTTKVSNILHGYGMENDICIVPSGVDLSRYDYHMDEADRKAKRSAIGIPDDCKVIINLGRLGNEKNIEELVEFFAEAVQQDDKLRFLIVGGGPAKERLENLAEELGIAEYVIFTGMVPPALVREYYQLGDLFVSASTSETQGLTYVEAAANALPLLCRKDDCLDDIIDEGVNGFQYTTKEEFLEKLQWIMNNDAWRVTAGKHSEEKAESFDKSHFGDKVESIYEEAISANCG